MSQDKPIQGDDVIAETSAAEVWRILRAEAGASSRAIERDCFILYAKGRKDVPEYRFQGALGFGGKVYFRDGQWGVYYYPEDRNEKRDAIQAQTNAALAALQRAKGKRLITMKQNIQGDEASLGVADEMVEP